MWWFILTNVGLASRLRQGKFKYCVWIKNVKLPWCDVRVLWCSNKQHLVCVETAHTAKTTVQVRHTSSVKLPPVLHVIRHADLSTHAQMVRSYLMLFNRIRVNVALTRDDKRGCGSIWWATDTCAWVGPLMRLAWRVSLILSQPTVLVSYRIAGSVCKTK